HYAAIAAGLVVMLRGRAMIVRHRKGLGTIVPIRLALLLLVYGLSLGAACMYYAITSINEGLPQDLTKLLDYQPNRKSVVLSSEGEEVGTFSIENRRIIPLERMPPHVPA